MDELEISGKRYISTRLAGKEHNYHSDYIGQLIRGGKIIGTKVGRSWYVEKTSLDAYLEGSTQKEKSLLININSEPSFVPEKKIQEAVPEKFEKVVIKEEPVFKTKPTIEETLRLRYVPEEEAFTTPAVRRPLPQPKNLSIPTPTKKEERTTVALSVNRRERSSGGGLRILLPVGGLIVLAALSFSLACLISVHFPSTISIGVETASVDNSTSK